MPLLADEKYREIFLPYAELFEPFESSVSPDTKILQWLLSIIKLAQNPFGLTDDYGGFDIKGIGGLGTMEEEVTPLEDWQIEDDFVPLENSDVSAFEECLKEQQDGHAQMIIDCFEQVKFSYDQFRRASSKLSVETKVISETLRRVINNAAYVLPNLGRSINAIRYLSYRPKEPAIVWFKHFDARRRELLDQAKENCKAEQISAADEIIEQVEFLMNPMGAHPPPLPEITNPTSSEFNMIFNDRWYRPKKDLYEKMVTLLPRVKDYEKSGGQQAEKFEIDGEISDLRSAIGITNFLLRFPLRFSPGQDQSEVIASLDKLTHEELLRINIRLKEVMTFDTRKAGLYFA